MTNFNLKSQKFLTEESIIERTQDFQIYFQRIPSEGLRPTQDDEEAFPLGGFPIEIETKISKLITYSLSTFMI